MTGLTRLPIIRVVRLDGSRQEVRLDRSRVRVGSGADCDLVVRAEGASGHHLDIVRDSRGLVLEVAAGAERVHVNARPVRERALLHCGDMLSVGTCKLLLRQDADDLGYADFVPPQRVPTVKLIALRGVAGALSGKRLAIDPTLDLDHSIAVGCRGCVRLRCAGDVVAFDFVGADEDSGSLPTFNGLRITSGCLRAGDQIAWGGHRFVLEMPAPAVVADEPVQAAPDAASVPETAAGPQNEVWWLIATAAVLALGMAVVLLWNR